MPKKKIKKRKFEECIADIDKEINKRRAKWNLSALAWMDFEDVSQILRIHIFKKWDMYDPQKALAPWLNRIISNQIKNLIRNNYGNYCRPCLKCAAAEGDNLCKIYGQQDSNCPLYANWEKTKKAAHDIKMPVSLENHPQEVFNMYKDEMDILRNVEKIHQAMRKTLKPLEWKIYDFLYVKNLSEEETAKKMGYKTSESNRSPGYKQIKNVKKSIIKKVKKCISRGEIDIY